MTAKELMEMGYRVTSRKWGLVSRIDRPDWKEYMAKHHSPHSLEEGLEWVKLLGEAGAEDHYRRVYSEDTLEVPELARQMASSCGAVTGAVTGKNHDVYGR